MPTTKTVREASIAVAKAEQALAAAEAELKEAEAASHERTPEQQLAIDLHSALCRSDHTDMCGWEYEIHNHDHQWDRHAHSRYLKKAKVLSAQFPGADLSFAGDLLRAIKEL